MFNDVEMQRCCVSTSLTSPVVRKMQLLILLVTLLLTACAAPAPTDKSTRTPAPTPTASPTARLILPTFEPPTRTPLPATPISAPNKNQALGIADALLSAQVTPIPAALNAIDVNNAAQVTQLWQLGKGNLNALVWSPDGKTLAIGSNLGVYLYRASDLQLQRAYPTLTQVQMLAFSPDGTQLAVAANCLEIWQLPESNVTQRLDFCSRSFTALTFSPGGSFLAAGEYSSNFKYNDDEQQDWFVWETQTYTILQHHSPPSCNTDTLLDFFPDGSNLFVSDCDSNRIVQSRTGNQTGQFVAPSENIQGIAILPDGETILMLQNDLLMPYNFVTTKFAPPINTKNIINQWQVSPDGKTLFTLTNLYDEAGDGS